jgi:DNA polymerase-1
MFHPEHFVTEIVQTEKQLKELRDILAKANYIFFDTETSGLRVRVIGNDYTVGYTFAVEDEVEKDRVFYIPIAHLFECTYIPRLDECMTKLKLDEKYFPHYREVDKKFGGKSFKNMDLDVVISMLKPVLDYHGIKIAHNIMFDWHLLENDGINVREMMRTKMFDDTQIMFHTLFEEEPKKLEKIVESRYGIKKVDFEDVVETISNEEKKQLNVRLKKELTFNMVQIPIGAQYSGEDVWFMKQMYFSLIEMLKEDGTYEAYMNLRKPFAKVLWEMERTGIKLDLTKVKNMEQLINKELEKLKYEMFELVGMEINFSSGQQMFELLFGYKKLLKDKKTGEYRESFNEKIIERSFGFKPTAWTDGGKEKDRKLKNPKTDAKVLEDIASKDYHKKRQQEGKRFVELLITHTKLEDLLSKYIIAFQREVYPDGRIHPSLNLTAAVTGRISSSEPNMNNMKRPLEVPKVPKRENFEDEAAYKFELGRYKKEKEFYDFWIRFEVRSLMIPDNDVEDRVIIASDYNNIEKRVTACFSMDEALLQLFREGLDGHGLIATAIFPDELKGILPNEVKKKRPDLRQKGKQFGFLQLKSRRK